MQNNRAQRVSTHQLRGLVAQAKSARSLSRVLARHTVAQAHVVVWCVVWCRGARARARACSLRQVNVFAQSNRLSVRLCFLDLLHLLVAYVDAWRELLGILDCPALRRHCLHGWTVGEKFVQVLEGWKREAVKNTGFDTTLQQRLHQQHSCQGEKEHKRSS